jgi:hypothetical protein
LLRRGEHEGYDCRFFHPPYTPPIKGGENILNFPLPWRERVKKRGNYLFIKRAFCLLS